MGNLVERIAAAEDNATKTTMPTSKPTRAMPATTPAKLAAQVQALDDRTSKWEDRLQEVESVVEQLNDCSTQPAASTTTQKTLAALEAQIMAVEKQLHAALGAKIKMDATGNTEPCRIPSIHQLNNYVESTRKRLKHIEDMDGLSKCS